MERVLTPPRPQEIDRLLRSAARLLAPYIEAELGRAAVTYSHLYDGGTIGEYARKLPDGVIEKAIVLFEHLAEHGRMSSVELAAALGFDSPRAIPGALTTPLKRRAREMNLPLPFDGGEGSLPYGGITDPQPSDDRERTYWQDRDGIAERMVTILKGERATRLLYGPHKEDG